MDPHRIWTSHKSKFYGVGPNSIIEYGPGVHSPWVQILYDTCITPYLTACIVPATWVNKLSIGLHPKFPSLQKTLKLYYLVKISRCIFSIIHVNTVHPFSTYHVL